ncbi:alcohol dehydrogenase [bacterium M21]|nr:alcohol dehydrogenase [bacterium M21]
MEFQYYIPTRILFGPGKLNELATTSFLPGKKALIVISAGTSMRKHGYLERVQSLLKENGVESVVFDKILANPILAHVHEGAAMAREMDCDFVIGLGGGSSMDSAKSIALMAKNDGDYWDYVNGGSGKGEPVKNGALPIVAITTTAGTGTEADPWTVITKTETNEKIGFGIDETFPVLSIVDPELMVSVPPKLTAYQGMDAFFHAVEGYLANIRQPVSDAYALSSIKLVAENLAAAVEDGTNIEARSAIAWANTQSGMVESTSCVISHHSLGHALSALYPEVPHGAGLVLLSVAYFTYLIENSPEASRFTDMARAMGESVDALPRVEQPMAFIRALKRLIVTIGLADLKLTDFGVEKSSAHALAENAKDTMGFLFTLDPCELSMDVTTKIIEDSF